MGVNPFDIEQQAAAIHEALTMPRRREARARASSIRRVVEGNSIEKWVAAQFADIDAKLAAAEDGG